ncbi:MAG: flagellar basal body P-ring protein FlgI [Thermoguttaceae bacterium]|jgi:flagellar basal body P-ring protein FlgI
MKRRHFLLWSAVVGLGGCAVWDLHGPGANKPDEAQKSDSPPKLVGDLATPFGLFPVKVEAVSLVMGLNGTGSDPEPSPQRAMLIEEMKRRNVKNPNQLLASRNAALVLVRAILRPGIQKGDRFDVEVRIPGRSETMSLRGGCLLETRLNDTALVENRLFNGKVRGLAQGPVLVDPSATDKSAVALLCRGRVLGGGVALEPRSLGLLLKSGDETEMTPQQLRDAAMTSSRVANAINRQFHTFKDGIKVGVATAKTGRYVDLAVHPRYKDNIERYMQVLRAVGLEDSIAETSRRIISLEAELLDPSTAARAALQLEALGKSGVPPLLKGIQSANAEVRFVSAEALAYLDRPEAAEPLAEAARQEPAFRAMALTALAAMDEFTASDQLRQLLGVPSAETRYGAFRALWRVNPNEPLVKGEQLGGQFSYHVLDTAGPSLVHVARSQRAEVVLFGRDQRLLTPLAINAGPHIMINSGGGEAVSVSKFTSNQPDQRRAVSPRLDEVIRAIVDLGGTYPDVVQALQEAKASGALESRFEVEAVPATGRLYDSTAQGEPKAEAEKPPSTTSKGNDAPKGLDKDGWKTADLRVDAVEK